jgi:hypothetical protein
MIITDAYNDARKMAKIIDTMRKNYDADEFDKICKDAEDLEKKMANWNLAT